MFQTAIDLQTFADLFERMSDVSQSDKGSTLVTHGRHPDIGTVVAIQDIAPFMIIHSEFPMELALDLGQGL